MKFFRVLKIHDDFINAIELGLPISLLRDPNWWVGTPRNDSYLFWSKLNSMGDLKIPLMIQIGDQIHLGFKNDQLSDRIKWVVVDFDDLNLLIKPIDEQRGVNQIYGTHGKNQTTSMVS